MANIFSVKFLRDDLLVSCSADSVILSHRITESGLTQDLEFSCCNCRVKKIGTFPSDSNSFYTVGEDGSLRRFDAREGASCSTSRRCSHIQCLPIPDGINSISMDKWGENLIVVGGMDSEVCLLDKRKFGSISVTGIVQTYSPLHSLFGSLHDEIYVTGVRFSHDSSQILCSYDGTSAFLFNTNFVDEQHGINNNYRRLSLPPPNGPMTTALKSNIGYSHIMEPSNLLNDARSSLSIVKQHYSVANRQRRLANQTEAQAQKLRQTRFERLEQQIDILYAYLNDQMPDATIIIDNDIRNDLDEIKNETNDLRCKIWSELVDVLTWRFDDSRDTLTEFERDLMINRIRHFTGRVLELDPLNRSGNLAYAWLHQEFDKPARALHKAVDLVERLNDDTKALRDELEPLLMVEEHGGDSNGCRIRDIYYEEQACRRRDVRAKELTIIAKDSLRDMGLESVIKRRRVSPNGNDNMNKTEPSTCGPSTPPWFSFTGDLELESEVDLSPYHWDDDDNRTQSDKDDDDEEDNLPLDLSFAQEYSGHMNVRTIKDIGFFGPNSEYCVSGSDDGKIYIWAKDSGELVKRVIGDNNVVNCIEQHPSELLLASSGIDKDIKLWLPTADEPTECDSREAEEEHNRVAAEDLQVELMEREEFLQYVVQHPEMFGFTLTTDDDEDSSSASSDSHDSDDDLPSDA
eukprot:TRINITY_DN2170_c0_g2_i2.p1 TRINITY_DN2170_c0_g2~~TRINITY_DN2170_c0_g2_i2.p1  ORF type:complete len:688 (-),score=156.60 TRINITY_DN2170_c0_g2_i2:425-2488(-)